MIAKWLTDAIKANLFSVTERPSVREEIAWPVRPFKENERVFRSCYVCHITGMELGCLEYETQSVGCSRERGDGSKIRALNTGVRGVSGFLASLDDLPPADRCQIIDGGVSLHHRRLYL
jgi:hypothetical protein